MLASYAEKWVRRVKLRLLGKVGKKKARKNWQKLTEIDQFWAVFARF
jgi:hypothetical protein